VVREVRDAATSAALVARTNRVLSFAGLAACARTAEHALAVCAGTSLFVAAVERAVGHRLEGATRLRRHVAPPRARIRSV
jgi:uncharacterized protein YceH (UPF0502 family)